MSRRELLEAVMTNKRARATVRGMLRRAVRRREPIAIREIARRLLTRYPGAFDESSARSLAEEVATDYAARTRLRC